MSLGVSPGTKGGAPGTKGVSQVILRGNNVLTTLEALKKAGATSEPLGEGEVAL